MKKYRGKFRNQNGFTLIEIISVLIIIGIIAAVAMVRATSTRDYDLISQVEAVKAHLRLAQSVAMGLNSPHGIHFDSQTTYYLYDTTNSAKKLLPGANELTVDLQAKKSELQITAVSQNPVVFDAYGSPGTQNITITTNGGDIVITKNTGYIP
jgi:MSHA pilin protein MshC